MAKRLTAESATRGPFSVKTSQMRDSYRYTSNRLLGDHSPDGAALRPVEGCPGELPRPSAGDLTRLRSSHQYHPPWPPDIPHRVDSTMPPPHPPLLTPANNHNGHWHPAGSGHVKSAIDPPPPSSSVYLGGTTSVNSTLNKINNNNNSGA